MKFSIEQRQNDPVMKMVMCLLHSVTNAHILHLTTRSYSQHKALKHFYEDIAPLVDDFAESFQGKYGLLTDFTSDFVLPGTPLEYMNYLKSEVSTLRRAENFPQDSELQNTVDEIVNLIDGTTYKLKFLS